jgi:microcin C transport system permease protein|tara:strand:- start:89 stop:619 length:531 start_codon:yes stop_codon:yes gene_type:complete
MRDYFFRRFSLVPPTLLGVTIIIFAITRLVPGGPLERATMETQQLNTTRGISTSIAGQNMALSDAQLQKLREYYGFDKPVLVSYYDWVVRVIQGDLGSSYRYNEPVWEAIRSRFPVSLYYGLVTLVITYLVCIPLGVVKAIKHRTVIDNVSSILIFVGYAIPGYARGSLHPANWIC